MQLTPQLVGGQLTELQLQLPVLQLVLILLQLLAILLQRETDLHILKFFDGRCWCKHIQQPNDLQQIDTKHFRSINQSINQSIKTRLYSTTCVHETEANISHST